MAASSLMPRPGAAATPITASSAFSYPDFDSGARRSSGEEPGYMYSRLANPTVNIFEQKLAAFEGAETAVACASGMAAISATLVRISIGIEDTEDLIADLAQALEGL